MDKERTIKRRKTVVIRIIGRPSLRLEDEIRRIWEKCGFRIGVRWLWTEKHGGELLSRPDSLKL
jgi:hypothetical protein